MKEQLELIRTLRGEIEELIKSRDEVKREFDDCVQEAQDTSNEIKSLKDKLDEDRNLFSKESENKTRLLAYPICFIPLLVFDFLAGRELNNYFFSLCFGAVGACVSAETIITFFDISCNYENKFQQYITNKMRKYLFNKYPKLQQAYYNLYTITSEIQQKEEQLAQLETNKNSLETNFIGINDKLGRKKDELIELEGEYFDSMVFGTITEMNDNKSTIDSVNKSKVKIRIPEDN